MGNKSKEAFLLNKAELDPQYLSRREEVAPLVKEPESSLKIVFQPILHVQTREFFGFEALSRLVETTSFTNIANRFSFAEKSVSSIP